MTSYIDYEEPTAQSAPQLLTAGFVRTDTGNAERLVARHRDKIRYCPPRKKWLVWDGRRWAWDEIGRIEQLGKDTVRAIYQEATYAKDKDEAKSIAAHAAASESQGRRAALVKLAQAEPGIAVLPEDLDAEPNLFNVANGTIDLTTGELLEHNREHLITKLSPADYDESADSDVWNSFLSDVTGGDEQLASYLQRVFGYSLLGDVREKKFWLLYGPTDGGKSTFLGALARVFGDYYQNAQTSTWTVQYAPGGNRGDLVKLLGARLVTTAEFRRGARLDEEIMKRVTGRDPVTAAAKYEHELTYKPAFSLILSANDAPHIRPDDTGMMARAVRVPFETCPKAVDKMMPDKLAAPDVQRAILAWLVRGHRAWLEDGLGSCAAIEQSTAEYKREMDLADRFVTKMCEHAPQERTLTKDIRAAYLDWATDQDNKNQTSFSDVLKALRKRGCTPCKHLGDRAWQHVRLAEGAEPGAWPDTKPANDNAHPPDDEPAHDDSPPPSDADFADCPFH